MEKNDEKYPLLSHIDSPADLRKLPEDKLPEVCAEIRKFLIEQLSTHPGHFASSMGSVEITVASITYSTPPTTASCGMSATKPMAINS